jgi:hypothetical protein
MAVYAGTIGLALKMKVKTAQGVDVVLDTPGYVLSVRLAKPDGGIVAFSGGAVAITQVGGNEFQVVTNTNDLLLSGIYILQLWLTTPAGLYPSSEFEFVVLRSRT